MTQHEKIGLMSSYIKFDHIFGLWSFITQFNNETFGNSTAHNGKFNTSYKTCITYTEGEKCGIMWRGGLYL